MGSGLERAVRAYTVRSKRWQQLSELSNWQDAATMPDIDTAILALANAIEQCGRDIMLSLSPGGTAPLQNLPYFRRGNMLRITADIWDRRADIQKGFDAWKRFSGTACAGFWPDLDMIPFGQLLLMSRKEHATEGGARLAGFGYNRRCQFSKDQQRTFITMRALAASPLFIGGDLPTMDEFSVSLLTNREMLACDQNGVMGVNVYARDGAEVWVAAECDRPGMGWLGVFNRNESAKTASLGLAELGLEPGRYEFRDVWKGGTFTVGRERIPFELAADGVSFIRYSRLGAADQSNP
jgi:hypothetical protein